MAKFSWSEVFTSIEGEGPYSGWPTTYIRFTGCNFECRGFNNPEGVDTTLIETLGFDPQQYNNIYDIPLITKGCDSIYSWDSKFSHMWETGDENKLAECVIEKLSHNAWSHPTNNHPTILSITGGEPTLRAKTIPTLLNHPLFTGLRYLLIETNCAVPLSDKFIQELDKWTTAKAGRKLIWSNSPKLSVSGEPWEKAIRPDIASKQTNIWGDVEQYFKFVCGPMAADFDEVYEAMEMYYNAGISRDTKVYVMPTACLEEQQQKIAAAVADMCINRGYVYCHRTHVSVFGNEVGT